MVDPMSNVTRVSLNSKQFYGAVRGRFVSKMTYLNVLSRIVSIPQATYLGESQQLCLFHAASCRCKSNVLTVLLKTEEGVSVYSHFLHKPHHTWYWGMIQNGSNGAVDVCIDRLMVQR